MANTRFLPGTSGNPEGGRAAMSATVADVVKIARRRLTKPALETLLNIMRDPEAPASAKVRAAEVSLERAWGPAQSLEAQLRTATPAELQRLTDQILEMRAKAEKAAQPPAQRAD